MADYQFDVFISYRRDPYGVFNEWMRDTFIPLFMWNLRNSIEEVCGRDMNDVFYDQAKLDDRQRKMEGIEPGEDWKNALSTAIKESRCVLALWSPGYFHSEWCQIEWNSFRQRHPGLVVPISIHDGLSFPKEASRTQFENFSDYVILGAAFKAHPNYVKLQEKVKELTTRIAKVVKGAPPFQDWQVINNPQTVVVEAETPIPQHTL